jgi:hypothetical protein
VPFEEGRLLASAIPGARLVPLESDNHVLLEHEPAWHRFLSEVDGFVRGDSGEDNSPLSADLTMLMTDMSGPPN